MILVKLKAITKSENLAFFDAIAPIIYLEDVDMTKAWFQSRYDKGENSQEKKSYRFIRGNIFKCLPYRFKKI